MKVNCWFCNANSSVPYENYNSFVCTKCDQYNGFSDDGDYNREIPEQHQLKLNLKTTTYCQRIDQRLLLTNGNNGLCETCNRNQEMKVIQLANFKPRCELNYEEEIEEYKQKLEDSYQLCQRCNRHVNKTLNGIKTKFIGSKFAKIMQKGAQMIKNGSNAETGKTKILDKIVIIALVVVSVMNLTNELNISIEISNEQLRTFYFHSIALKLTIIDIITPLFKIFGTEIILDGLSTTAILLNLWIFCKQTSLRLHAIISMMLWSSFMLIDELPIDPISLARTRGSFAIIIAAISVSIMVKCFTSKDPIVSDTGKLHKMTSDLVEYEESDTEMEFSQQSVASTASFVDTQSSIVYSPSLSSFSSSPNTLKRTNINKTLTFPPNRIHQNNMSFSRTENRPFDTMSSYSNRTFSIRDEVTAADRNQVQKDITNLNISTDHYGSTSTLKDYNTGRYMNPFALGKSRCDSPSPSIASVFSGANRSQIVAPPRLDSSNKGEANWIAGGFWSSPPKQSLEINHMRPDKEMSRSSSQSSGLGTTDSDKNSRENSIINEEFNQSIFSEPVRRRNLFFDKSAFSFDKTPTSRSLFEPTFTHPKPNSFFPTTNDSYNSSFKKYRDSSAPFYK